MPASDDEFRRLLEQVQSGSQDAMCQLIERYAPHIVHVVRRNLKRAIRAKFDSVDFVQAVWASFFAAPQEGVRFDRPEDLVKYLSAIAHNKVVDEVRRRMQTNKYNINRERSLEDSTLHLSRRLASQEPSPSEVAVADELWRRLICDLPAHHQQILELRRAGHTLQQIADQLGLNERTVRRVIQGVLRSRRCDGAQ